MGEGGEAVPAWWHPERLALALDAGGTGTWFWDATSNVVSWDERMERVFGLEPGSFGGTFEEYAALLHPDDREPTLEAVERSRSTLTEHVVEHRVQLPDGTLRWVTGRGRPLLAADGSFAGMVGVGQDVTAQKLAEQRVDFLSRAGALLGSSLDIATTLEQLAELAVEHLADWCSIDLVEPEGVRLAAVAHRDPEKVAYARRLRERFGVQTDADRGLGLVLRTGLPDVLPEIPDELIRESLEALPGVTPQDLEEFLALGLRASMTVPLVSATDEVLGALTLVSAESGRPYDDLDVELAVELARRAAVAVHNAQLYAAASHAAAAFQRSLLPARLPALEGVDVAAHYAAAAPGDVIGGDFYEVLPLPEDRFALMIGDVSGKGIDAAALTAAARWVLRAALARGASPREAVDELNDALLAQPGERFVTVLAGVLTPVEGGVELVYASGGHPPPVVRRVDGTCAALPTDGKLVGVLPGPTATEFSAVLSPGDALAVYTDGYTETRVAGRLYGEEGMLCAFGGAAQPTAAERVAHVRADVEAFGPSSDDMALVVVLVRG